VRIFEPLAYFSTFLLEVEDMLCRGSDSVSGPGWSVAAVELSDVTLSDTPAVLFNDMLITPEVVAMNRRLRILKDNRHDE
jgi:hypothetical protein